VEKRATSRLCATFQPGTPVALMGPTGVRTRIGEGGETVMIVADSLAIAELIAIVPALRAAGSRVLALLRLNRAEDVFLRPEIELAAACVIWCTEEGAPLRPARPCDRAATGSVPEVLGRLARGALEPAGARPPIALEEVTRVHIVGSSRLVRSVRDAGRGELAPHLCRVTQTFG